MTLLGRFLRHQSIAILALLVACGGTSYAGTRLAANSVGTQQLKAGAVTSAKVRNGSLTVADLRKGVVPGPRTSVLRRGETVRGQLTGDFSATMASQDYRVSASFPIPLPGLPDRVYVDGVTPNETCTGDSLLPTAPAGTLCVYPLEATNPALGPGTHYLNQVTRWGFNVQWVAQAAGDTYFASTWAYTQG